jgi:hypothetical protein
MSFTDILLLSAGKAIGQSVMGLLNPVFKNVEFLRTGLKEHVTLVGRQQEASNAKM